MPLDLIVSNDDWSKNLFLIHPQENFFPHAFKLHFIVQIRIIFEKNRCN